MPSLYVVKSIIILDNDGNRVFAKVNIDMLKSVVSCFAMRGAAFQYYNQSLPTVKEQKEFEKSLFNKTHKGTGDVVLLDNWTIVYRNNVDLLFYVMGSSNENEVPSVSIAVGKRGV